MTDIKFSFEPWNFRKDQRILRASTSRAFGLVDNDIEFLTDQSDDSKQKILRPVADEVIALLAECLDWLRKNEIAPEYIQSRVRALKQQNIDHQKRVTELTVQKLGVFEAPDLDRKGERLSKTKKPRNV